MKYYYNTIVTRYFEDKEAKVVELLKNEGFGVLTQIDM